MFKVPRILCSLPDDSLTYTTVSVGSNKHVVNNKMRVLYTNADQFLNKRDLLLVQIAGNTPSDIIVISVISEILPKAPNAVVNLSLITLPGYYCYLNFDPNNYDPTSSNIHGVGIYVHHKLQASQVFFNSPHIKDHVWASIRLQGSDLLLVGCIYRSPSGNIDASTASLCDLLNSLHNYTHLLICGTLTIRQFLGLTFLVLVMIVILNHVWI